MKEYLCFNLMNLLLIEIKAIKTFIQTRIGNTKSATGITNDVPS